MRNIVLYLTYLGTAYHGWQVQKDLVTVAGTLEAAAEAVVGHRVHMTGLGRTDAGVHARVYVANFRTSSTIPVPPALCPQYPPAAGCGGVPGPGGARGLQCHWLLRPQIPIPISSTTTGFRNPFYVDRVWFYPRLLDEAVMQAAADQFVGTHDFAAVRSVGTDVRSTVRTGV